MSHNLKHIYAFGPYRLDSGERLLARDGLPVALQPKAFDLLLALVERHGRLMTKEELLRLIWPDSVVEEVNLANNVSILRKTLGEDGQQFIETVPRHGYRFVALVREEPGEKASDEVREGTVKGADEEIREESGAKEIEVGARHGIAVARFSDANRRRRISAPVVLLAILLCATLAGGFIWNLSNRRPVAAGSIAVLPFRSIAAGERDELLELGMADAVITKLSGAGRLVVRPTGDVRRYASAEQDPLAAGRELRVDLVLDGSLQKFGDRVRVTTRLLRVADGTAVWADTLEEKQTDLFRIQEMISRRIAESLALEITREQQVQMGRYGTRNTEAFRLYVQGRYFARQETREGFKKAVDFLTRAINLDPGYAPAHSALSQAWKSASGWHLPPTEAMPKSRAAAEQALRLDEQFAEAHAGLGWVKMIYDWDRKAAERDFKRAIDIDPTNIRSRMSYAWFLTSVERYEEAFDQVQMVGELDPTRLRGAAVLYFAHRYDEVIELSRRILATEPHPGATLQWLGLAYDQKGMYREAITAFQKLMDLDDTPDLRAYLGHAYARSGDQEKALRMLENLKEQSRERYVSSFYFALIHAALGENDQALDRLKQACDERDGWMIWLGSDPRFDRLRSDPRFMDLKRCVGLIH